MRASIARILLVAAAATLAVVDSYAQVPAFPMAVSFPALPAASQQGQRYAQHEFILRDRTVRLRGRLWSADFDYSSAGDARAALGAIVADLQEAGWEVLLRDAPRNPPLATLKHKGDGREVWAQVEVLGNARITWLEPGLPTARLTLPTPSATLVPVVAGAGDFAMLPAYPGSRLLGTSRNEAAGSWVRQYATPSDATPIEVATVYLDALKVTGWEVVEDTTEGKSGTDPVIVACWVRDGIEVWTRIVVRGGTHSIEASPTPLG